MPICHQPDPIRPALQSKEPVRPMVMAAMQTFLQSESDSARHLELQNRICY